MRLLFPSQQYAETFQQKLASWYEVNKRALPWRDTKDAYKIWLSEIILQQTRVEQGLNYYLRFVEQYPTVKELAKADEQDVLKLWQGLGYYSRARNLHKAAKTIVEIFGSSFPEKIEDVLLLKGIGTYTAAAICSFAYNTPVAVVDGNVYRVIARILEISTPIDTNAGKKQFQELADKLLDKQHPAIHNQAMMDFGATVCTPLAPKCEDCPITHLCASYQKESMLLFPVKEKKQKQRNRYFNYLFITQGDATYIHQRTEKDIWKELYELPLIETASEINREELLNNDEIKELFGNKRITMSSKCIKIKHVLSHQIIHAQFYSIKIEENKDLKKYKRIQISTLDEYPISRLTERFLERILR